MQQQGPCVWKGSPLWEEGVKEELCFGFSRPSELVCPPPPPSSTICWLQVVLLLSPDCSPGPRQQFGLVLFSHPHPPWNTTTSARQVSAASFVTSKKNMTSINKNEKSFCFSCSVLVTAVWRVRLMHTHVEQPPSLPPSLPPSVPPSFLPPSSLRKLSTWLRSCMSHCLCSLHLILSFFSLLSISRCISSSGSSPGPSIIWNPDVTRCVCVLTAPPPSLWHSILP